MILMKVAQNAQLMTCFVLLMMKNADVPMLYKIICNRPPMKEAPRAAWLRPKLVASLFGLADELPLDDASLSTRLFLETGAGDGLLRLDVETTLDILKLWQFWGSEVSGEIDGACD